MSHLVTPPRTYVQWICVLVIAASASSALAQSQDESVKLRQRVAAHLQRIQALRIAGKFEKALEVANELVAMEQEERPRVETPEGAEEDWQTIEANCICDDLKSIVALLAAKEEASDVATPSGTRSKLARAFSISHDTIGSKIDKHRVAEALRLGRLRLHPLEGVLGKNSPDLAAAMADYALALQADGQDSKAEGLLEDAIVILEQVFPGGHPLLSLTYHTIGLVSQKDPARLAEAEDYFTRSAKLKRDLCPEKRSALGDTLARLADVQARQSNFGDAERNLKEALGLVAKTGPRYVLHLTELATLLSSKGDYGRSGLYFEQAIDETRKLCREYPDLEEHLVSTLFLFVAMLCNKRDLDECEKRLLEAGQVIDDMRNTAAAARNRVVGLYYLGFLRLQQGKFHHAKACLVRAAQHARRVYGPESGLVAASVGALGAVFRCLGEYGQAERMLRLVLRPEYANVIPDDARFQLAMVLVLNGRPEDNEEAKALLEASRDLVSAKRKDLVGAAHERTLFAARYALTDAVYGLSLLHTKKKDDIIIALKSVEDARALLAADLLKLHDRSGLPRDGENTESSLAKLTRDSSESGTLVLNYAWSALFVLLHTIEPTLSKEKSEQPLTMRGFVLGQGHREAKALQEALQNPHARLSLRPEDRPPDLAKNVSPPKTPDAKTDDREWSTLLKKLLPLPLREKLFAADNLVVVADGPLRELPFEPMLAKLDPQKAWHVSYSPSTRAYMRAREIGEHSVRSAEDLVILVVADPDYLGQYKQLPNARLEAAKIECIGSGVDASVLILAGADATGPAVRELTPRADIVIFTGHCALGSPEKPYDTHIPLAPVGGEPTFLSLASLISGEYECKTGALIVLSGCSTQQGLPVGESLPALSWGFFKAGAAAVVASLWRVDDRAAALLISRFIENYVDKGMSKSEALWEAKMWFRQLTESVANAYLSAGAQKETPASSYEVVDNRPSGARAETGTTPVVEAKKLDFRDDHFIYPWVLIGDPR